MSIPTPEEFLTTYDQPDEPEEIELEPLESIAQSLRCLVAVAAEKPGDVVLVPPPEQEAEEDGKVPGAQYDELLRDFDDLEDKHRVLFELVEEIAAIVKPSTSKVSLEVKAAIERWKAPEVPPESGPVDERPAHDAVWEEWARYAEDLGYTVDSSMNRSQIRTLLGIEQPVRADS